MATGDEERDGAVPVLGAEAVAAALDSTADAVWDMCLDHYEEDLRRRRQAVDDDNESRDPDPPREAA